MKVMTKDKKDALLAIRKKMIEEGKVVNKQTTIDYVCEKIYDKNGFLQTKKTDQ